MSLTDAPGIYGVVRNIPSSFHSSDLRNFFSDFIEKEKFRCFHFKHRPEVSKSNTNVAANKDGKNRTFCGVFQVVDERSLTGLVQKYNETNWVDCHGNCMKGHCFIHKIRVSSDSMVKNNIATSVVGYSTRGESNHRRRHAVTEEFSQSDLMSLSELRPPTHIMPRGNVGTTIKEFMKLIKDCKLPPRIIKKLGLKFPKTGSNRRYGNVPFQYLDTFAAPVSSADEHVYTAGGDEIEKNSTPEPEEGASSHQSPKEVEPTPSGGEESGPDDDNDTCEEWERHEALHSDVTSQERTKERLFEEEIELKWEKGGSGLVFYTDAQYWEEQEGDFDEQTTDDWDVDMSIYYGGTGDMDARQYQQMRKERRNGLYDDSLDNSLNSKSRRRARSESPPDTKRRGYFERHTKGIGRRLLEEKGWKEGDPLGPSTDSGAITDPVHLDGQHPRLRKGLGFHGEKLLTRDDAHDRRDRNKERIHKRVLIRPFRTVRSVEPMASHSYDFPQFDFNLSNEFKERTRSERRKAVPGDDGVVITTAYDDPLDIDRPEGLLRSRHHYALKRRRVGAEERVSDSRFKGAGLTHRAGLEDSLDRTGGDKPSPKTDASCSSLPLSTPPISTMRFVSGGLLKEK